jgi:hypothetical protein
LAQNVDRACSLSRIACQAPGRGSFEDIPVAILPQCCDRGPRIITFVVIEKCPREERFNF